MWMCCCGGETILIATHWHLTSPAGSGTISRIDDSDGTFIWTVSLGSDYTTGRKRRAVGAAIDSDGSIYVIWDLPDDLVDYTHDEILDGTATGPAGGVCRLDSSGNIDWTITFDDKSSDYRRSNGYYRLPNISIASDGIWCGCQHDSGDKYVKKLQKSDGAILIELGHGDFSGWSTAATTPVQSIDQLYDGTFSWDMHANVKVLGDGNLGIIYFSSQSTVLPVNGLIVSDDTGDVQRAYYEAYRTANIKRVGDFFPVGSGSDIMIFFAGWSTIQNFVAVLHDYTDSQVLDSAGYPITNLGGWDDLLVPPGETYEIVDDSRRGSFRCGLATGAGSDDTIAVGFNENYGTSFIIRNFNSPKAAYDGSNNMLQCVNSSERNALNVGQDEIDKFLMHFPHFAFGSLDEQPTYDNMTTISQYEWGLLWNQTTDTSPDYANDNLGGEGWIENQFVTDVHRYGGYEYITCAGRTNTHPFGSVQQCRGMMKVSTAWDSVIWAVEETELTDTDASFPVADDIAWQFTSVERRRI